MLGGACLSCRSSAINARQLIPSGRRPGGRDEREGQDNRHPARRAAYVRSERRVPLQGQGDQLQPLRSRRGRPRGVLGGAGEEVRLLVQALRHGAGMEPPLREVVRRRPAERLVQLPGPPRRGRAWREGRLSLRGREGRHPRDHLCGVALECLPAGQRAQEARHPARRPGRDLHAHDPGAADGDAGVRANRGGPLGGLRRVQRRGGARSYERCRRRRDHHRRRGLAPRRPGTAQAQRRRGL